MIAKLKIMLLKDMDTPITLESIFGGLVRVTQYGNFLRLNQSGYFEESRGRLIIYYNGRRIYVPREQLWTVEVDRDCLAEDCVVPPNLHDVICEHKKRESDGDRTWNG